MEGEKYCIYLRVSTRMQGSSGLGIDAQRNTCTNYIISQKGMLDREFCEVESGTKRDRKILLTAIDYCKENNCVLVFANLSRLARDIEFTFKVINTGVEVYFCDMPQINTLILGLMATVAQYEREQTSQRTKAALAENKKRGILSGSANPNWSISPENERKRAFNNALSRNLNVIERPEFAAFCRILRKLYKELDVSDKGEKFFLHWDTTVKIKVDCIKVDEIIASMKEANACNSELFRTIDFNSETIVPYIRAKVQSTFKSIKKYHELNNQNNGSNDF